MEESIILLVSVGCIVWILTCLGMIVVKRSQEKAELKKWLEKAEKEKILEEEEEKRIERLREEEKIPKSVEKGEKIEADGGKEPADDGKVVFSSMTRSHPYREKEEKLETVISYQRKKPERGWVCLYCEGENQKGKEICEICGRRRGE